jgi:hypothetical protein
LAKGHQGQAFDEKMLRILGHVLVVIVITLALDFILLATVFRA